MSATPKQLMPPDARGAHSLHRLVGPDPDCPECRGTGRCVRYNFGDPALGTSDEWECRCVRSNTKLSSERAAEPQQQTGADARRLLE